MVINQFISIDLCSKPRGVRVILYNLKSCSNLQTDKLMKNLSSSIINNTSGKRVKTIFKEPLNEIILNKNERKSILDYFLSIINNLLNLYFLVIYCCCYYIFISFLEKKLNVKQSN